MAHENGVWRCDTLMRIYDADIDAYRVRYGKVLGELRFFRDHVPARVVRRRGNLLMYGGVSCLWETLIGRATMTAGQLLTFFDATHAALGVGDATVATAAGQTDLQATVNVARQAMDANYPFHVDGTTSASASCTFQATWGGSAANFAWNEWGVFNSAVPGQGRMMNRKVESLGTKTSGQSATLQITLSIA